MAVAVWRNWINSSICIVSCVFKNMEPTSLIKWDVNICGHTKSYSFLSYLPHLLSHTKSQNLIVLICYLIQTGRDANLTIPGLDVQKKEDDVHNEQDVLCYLSFQSNWFYSSSFAKANVSYKCFFCYQKKEAACNKILFQITFSVNVCKTRGDDIRQSN